MMMMMITITLNSKGGDGKHILNDVDGDDIDNDADDNDKKQSNNDMKILTFNFM